MRISLIVLLLPGLLLGQQTVSDEYELKAAYLFSFLKYVEWPGRSTGPLVVCVTQANPFGRRFSETMTGDVNGRPVEHRVVRGADIAPCHALFIARSVSPRQLLKVAQSSNTLTVGESTNFIAQGGMINFVMQGSKLRFEINAEAAELAGVRISAQLLRLRLVPGGAQP
ncbi:MAG TPA: YfiR family protein [Vicinamibacterales bacterium]|nr:YfiR family protein [Vicinamibacterales bacterium]